MKPLGTFLTLLAATLLPGTLTLASGVATGDPAPEFTLTDTSETAHSLSDFSGKYVVLEWTNYGCPFVKKHYSQGHMQALQKRYGAMDDVVWLAICSSASGRQGYMTAEQAAEANQENDFAATAYLMDTDGTVGRAYGARRTPQMFIINPQGNVVYQGAIDSIRSADPGDIGKADNYVAQALDALLAGKSPSPATTQPYGCGIKY
jgi:peroxiredoxin